MSFSTIHNAFVGDGIPPIPEDAREIKVSKNTVAFLADTGEAWECFLGNGTSSKSQTYYWPSVDMCPRAWAQERRS